MSLAARMRALRLAMLAAMGRLSRESPRSELLRVTGFWKRYRVEATRAAQFPGEAADHFLEVYATEEWRHFSRLRAHDWHQRPDRMASKREYAKRYYAEKAKSKRSEPETREKMNAQRRERYRIKKTAMPRSNTDE